MIFSDDYIFFSDVVAISVCGAEMDENFNGKLFFRWVPLNPPYALTEGWNTQYAVNCLHTNPNIK